jgi:hypothetical protein
MRWRKRSWINQGLSFRYVNTTTITICACLYFTLHLLLHLIKTVIYIHTYVGPSSYWIHNVYLHTHRLIGAHLKIYIDSYVNTYCINTINKFIHICIRYIHAFIQINLCSSKAYLTATDSGTLQSFRPCAVGGHSLQAALLRLQTLLANSKDNRVRILSPNTSTYH